MPLNKETKLNLPQVFLFEISISVDIYSEIVIPKQTSKSVRNL